MKYGKYILAFGVLLLIAFSCHKKDDNASKSDTIIEGNTSILVDETLLPVIEDQKMVFESTYKAKLKLLPQSEKEAVISLTQSKADIIILSRKLTKGETGFFSKKKIVPKSTPFAIDAVAFVKNKQSADTLVALADVLDFMKGKKNGIKGLVFDNPNSSTSRYLCDLAGISSLPTEGVYSFKTNEDVIDYISKNEGMIGVIGLNWLYEPKPDLQAKIDKINVLSMKGTNGATYVYPDQESVATRKYPLARVLYIINCQGYDGLGMGFASFIAGERGQRIMLQSGLAPIREPGRNINIRTEIEKNDKLSN